MPAKKGFVESCRCWIIKFLEDLIANTYSWVDTFTEYLEHKVCTLWKSNGAFRERDISSTFSPFCTSHPRRLNLTISKLNFTLERYLLRYCDRLSERFFLNTTDNRTKMSKIHIACRSYRDFFQWIFTLGILHAIDNRFFVVEGDALIGKCPKVSRGKLSRKFFERKYPEKDAIQMYFKNIIS